MRLCEGGVGNGVVVVVVVVVYGDGMYYLYGLRCGGGKVYGVVVNVMGCGCGTM